MKTFLENCKPVAAVWHASAVLLHVKDDSDEPFIEYKNITGFTNSEEEAFESNRNCHYS